VLDLVRAYPVRAARSRQCHWTGPRSDPTSTAAMARPLSARSPARPQRQTTAAAYTPRRAAASRRGQRLRVQSPSLAGAAHRGPVSAPEPAPPPATPPLRWLGDTAAPRGKGATAASVRRIAAALWRAHPPPREPGEARRRFEVSSFPTSRSLRVAAVFLGLHLPLLSWNPREMLCFVLLNS
jgi:hypothetical protein